MDNDEFINKNLIKTPIGRKKDNIYKYFVKDENNCKCYCTINNCNQNFSITSSTSTLKNHVNKKHCGYLNNNNNINNNTNMNNTNKTNKKINVYNAYSRVFAKNSLPHSLLENCYFIDFITAIKENPNVVISKQKLRELIVSDGNKLNFL